MYLIDTTLEMLIDSLRLGSIGGTYFRANFLGSLSSNRR